MNTFLVQGVVAGTWKHEAGRVKTEAFRPLEGATGHEVREEADRLALLYA